MLLLLFNAVAVLVALTPVDWRPGRHDLPYRFFIALLLACLGCVVLVAAHVSWTESYVAPVFLVYFGLPLLALGLRLAYEIKRYAPRTRTTDRAEDNFTSAAARRSV